MPDSKTINNLLTGITCAFSLGLFVLSGILIMSSDQLQSVALASDESTITSVKEFSWTISLGIFGVLLAATSFAFLGFMFAHRHHEM
jgi:magnesium-transporting ATPase (P-type)